MVHGVANSWAQQSMQMVEKSNGLYAFRVISKYYKSKSTCLCHSHRVDIIVSAQFSRSSVSDSMPANHLILCHPLLLLPSIFPSIRVFFNESVLCIRWPTYWSFRRQQWPPNMGWLIFMGWVISQANKWQDYPNYFEQGAVISKNLATFWLFMVGLGTVMVPVGVSFSMLVYCNAHIMRLKVHRKSNLLPSCTQQVLTSLCCVLNSYVFLLMDVPCPLALCLRLVSDFFHLA